MRKVMIATPVYDGKVDVWYMHSLIQTIKLGLIEGIEFLPINISGDALIQRARNDLAKIAIETKMNGVHFESVLWIDSDMQWDPTWAIELVNRKEDVIGGTCRKKNDDDENYVVNLIDTEVSENGYILSKALGLGFAKVSLAALNAAWDLSEAYTNPCGNDSRMVFDIGIVDGELYGEDTLFFMKLSKAGFEIWLDPKLTCNHIGIKKYTGDFEKYLKKLKKETNF